MFSDHPSPGNRVAYVSEEVEGYGGRGIKTSPEFEQIKKRAAAVKVPKKTSVQPTSTTGPSRGRSTRTASDARGI